MKKFNLSDSLKSEIIDLYKEGYSGIYIIKKTRVPQHIVYDIIKEIDRKSLKVERTVNFETFNSSNRYRISLPKKFWEGIGLLNGSNTVEVTLNKGKQEIIIKKSKEK